jgi:hypothetical protein
VLSLKIDFTEEQPFLVSYGKEVLEKIRNNYIETVKFRFAHPFLCTTNLICSFLMRFVSYSDNVKFCASWTTPGNGHDLSLCSGIAAAHALGARYPFVDDKAMCREFGFARKVIGQ